MKSYFYLLFIALFISCSSDDAINYDAQNETDIVKYISDNNLTTKKSNSGLYYVINNQGVGANPTTNSTVTVGYKGYFLDGKTFDENSSGIKFNLQQVIKGWTEGITYFKEGGKGILLIPSRLAYGSTARQGIPAGSVLIFDINLIKIH